MIEEPSGILEFAKLGPTAFLQLLLLGVGFLLWKFLQRFFQHNENQTQFLQEMMTEIRGEFAQHREFVMQLKNDLQQDIQQLGQQFSDLDKRVDDLSNSVSRMELITSLLEKNNEK